MTSKEAFVVGFLTRCADEGLTDAEVDARVKAASQLSKSADGGVATSLSRLGLAGLWGPPVAAVGLGAVLGGATGMMRGSAANMAGYDLEQLMPSADVSPISVYHKQRLKELYLRNAQQAKLKARQAEHKNKEFNEGPKPRFSLV